MTGETRATYELSNLDELKQQAQAQPSEAEAQYRYGWALLGAGQFDVAGRVFEDGLGRWPESIEFLYGLGMARKGAGVHAQAREYFEQVLKLAPKDVRSTMLKRLAEIQKKLVE